MNEQAQRSRMLDWTMWGLLLIIVVAVIGACLGGITTSG